MSKITEIVTGKADAFTTRIMIATALFAEKFYAGQEDNWGKVTNTVAIAAEKQLNDRSFTGDPRTFIETIKALTGETIQYRIPRPVQYSVGVAVVPVAPLYGERTDDGYELGQAYLCTNETSGGKFRNAGNLGEKGVRSTKSGVRAGDAPSNQWKLMSAMHDEVRPATEDEITALVEGLLAVKGLTLLHDLERELARYDAFLTK